MADGELKKNQDPLICYIRLYGDDKRRMLALTGGRRGHHNAIALAGTISRMALLEAAASPVSPAAAKAISEWDKVTDGADITPIIKHATRQEIQRQTARMGHAPGEALEPLGS